MHNLYGKRKLAAPEIRGSFTLSNGMFCVWGVPSDEGISVDVYDDASKKLLIGMEHGIIVNSKNPDSLILKMLLESYIDELEDSMIYYYGPHDRTFEESELTEPVPKKTGRFAK